MTLKECYEKLEGDYSGVLARLMREASISRFVQMMLKDTQLADLHTGLANNDYELAFRAVHTIKGTSLNLGLTKLADAAIPLTEALRNGAPTIDISSLVKTLEDEYTRTIATIQEYADNIEQ